MEAQEYIKAENYWIKHDEKSVKMAREAVLIAAGDFLSSHNTCSLACGCGDFVRCTPIEYNWLDGCIYMLSEGGMKFHALAENKNVCIAVYEPYKGLGELSGIQISGTAELVDFGTQEYSRALAVKNIPESAIRSLSHPMYLIKVVPKEMDLLFSEFKRAGFDTRQSVSF